MSFSSLDWSNSGSCTPSEMLKYIFVSKNPSSNSICFYYPSWTSLEELILSQYLLNIFFCFWTDFEKNGLYWKHFLFSDAFKTVKEPGWLNGKIRLGTLLRLVKMESHIQTEIVKLIIKLRRWLHFKYEELFQRATDRIHIVNSSFANSPLERDHKRGQLKLKGGKVNSWND